MARVVAVPSLERAGGGSGVAAAAWGAGRIEDRREVAWRGGLVTRTAKVVEGCGGSALAREVALTAAAMAMTRWRGELAKGR